MPLKKEVFMGKRQIKQHNDKDIVKLKEENNDIDIVSKGEGNTRRSYEYKQ